MKKWFRRVLLVVVLLALIVAGLYEATTHVGRGLLRGEAFYEGRPTSYWRTKIDEWLERFDTVEQAKHSIDLIHILSISRDGKRTDRSIHEEGWPPENSPPLPKPHQQTLISRIVDTFRGDNVGDFPPLALWGWPDSAAVLSELAEEARYQPLTDRSLKNVQLILAIQQEGDEAALTTSLNIPEWLIH